jgi:hypothetical protein
MVRRGVLLAVAALALAACGGDDPPPAERMSDAPGQVVWAVGDAATAGDAPKRLARLVTGGRVDRFLYLGDVYETGTLSEFRRYYDPLYGAVARKTSPVVGNHEDVLREAGYKLYWSARKGRGPRPFYSLRIAGWELIALDTEIAHGERSRQVRWLRRTLPAESTCRIAFWHRPRFNAGDHGDAPDVAPLWDALRGRAVAVLSGHDHNLQRLHPVDGITQFVSGAGGRELHEVDEDDERLAFSEDERFGGLRLVLREGVADWEFVADDGSVLDRGALRCR